MTTVPSSSSSALRALAARPWLDLLGFFAFAFCYHLWLEFQRGGLHGVDGYFHLKIAMLYASGEAPLGSGTFPWMQYSGLADLRADWQLGFHLLLIPFSWFGLVGGKVAVAAGAALVPALVYRILRVHRVPLAWLFAATVLCASEYYLVRAHLLRPTTLTVALLLVVAHLASLERARALFCAALGLLFVYDVPHNVLAVAGVAGGALLVVRGAFPWRVLLAVAGALVAAQLIHPGFWSWNDSFFGSDHGIFRVWDQMGGSLEASKNGDFVNDEGRWIPLAAPAEFQAPTPGAVRHELLLPLAVFLGSLALLALPPRRRSPAPYVFVGLAGVYFLLFLEHIRFAEYWVPFAATAGGLVVGQALGREATSDPPPGEPGRAAGWSTLAWLVALVVQGVVLSLGSELASAATWVPALVGGLTWLVASGLQAGDGACLERWRAALRSDRLRTAVWTLVVLLLVARGVRIGKGAVRRASDRLVEGIGDGRLYEEPMAWLAANTERDAVVFHTGWPQFSPMFFYNHWNRYLIGLDPYFFFQHDKKKYRRWVRISSGALSSQATHEGILGMNAGHAFLRHDDPVATLLEQVPGTRVVYRDERFRVVRLAAAEPR